MFSNMFFNNGITGFACPDGRETRAANFRPNFWSESKFKAKIGPSIYCTKISTGAVQMNKWNLSSEVHPLLAGASAQERAGAWLKIKKGPGQKPGPSVCFRLLVFTER